MYYCKKCQRLYSHSSLYKYSLRREKYCPIHTKEVIFKLIFSDEFCETKFVHLDYFLQDCLTKEGKLSYLDITKLSASDMLLLKRVYYFD